MHTELLENLGVQKYRKTTEATKSGNNFRGLIMVQQRFKESEKKNLAPSQFSVKQFENSSIGGSFEQVSL